MTVTPTSCVVAPHSRRLPGFCARRVTGCYRSIRITCVKRWGDHYETGVNWRKIKAEYISGKESQRALAEKYGVSRSTLIRRANKEHWTQKRKAAETECERKVQQKTAEKIAEVAADNAALMERAKTGLLRLAVGMIENFPIKDAQEVKRKQNGVILKYSLKDLAAVLSVVDDKTAKVTIDVEDLAPLSELLRDD